MVRRTADTRSVLTILLILALNLWPPGVAGVKCPPSCKCSWVLDSLQVDCSYGALNQYPNLDDVPVDHLDLSHNNFMEFPRQYADIETLTHLDLSNNRIAFVDGDALTGFQSLRTLILANNSLEGWSSISPNDAFTKAPNLRFLSLSGNSLGNYTHRYSEELLISESLSELELERCGINVIQGAVLQDGLPYLTRLSLSGNALGQVTSLPSQSLRSLALSDCKLMNFNVKLLDDLPNLEVLNLSGNRNIGASFSADKTNAPLVVLDLSACGLTSVDLSGLQQLTSLSVSNNLMRSIDAKMFAKNSQLVEINFSRNSLSFIDDKTFVELKRLSKIDLSYNEIARLDRNVFRMNEALFSLNLSRNFLEKFTKISSNSLREINLSWCEIVEIDPMALSGLASIQSLDLSNNLLRHFPSGMQSASLKSLDLSNCRLSAVQNTTFKYFPELARLRLNGNRFTNPFNADIFRSNKFLDEVTIGDNPWICHCNDFLFIDFYDFLTTEPPKLKDEQNVRCASPANYYGKTWKSACAALWNPIARTSSAEKVWNWIMIFLVVLAVLSVVMVCYRRYMRDRKQRDDAEEFRQNHEEMMEIRRQNQRMLEDEGTPNAPDPQGNCLPSYEDALRMPKLVRPTKSMVDLTSERRSRRQLRRIQTSPEEDIPEEDDPDGPTPDYKRFRSEEMLSNRDVERLAQIEPYRRTGVMQNNASGSRLYGVEDERFPSSRLKSQNLQSAEQIGNFQSYENSPYSKRKAKIAEIPPFKRATIRTDSIEFLTDYEVEATSKPGSPFAKRKPKQPSGDKASTQTPEPEAIYANLMIGGGGELEPAVEDHFGTAAAVHSLTTRQSPSSSTNSSDFDVVADPSSSCSHDRLQVEGEKRKPKRRSSSKRRPSENLTAPNDSRSSTSSMEDAPVLVGHKSIKQTLF